MMDAAAYLGFRGEDPARSLRRLVKLGKIKRSPMPGTGVEPRYGVRRSECNRFLADLAREARSA